MPDCYCMHVAVSRLKFARKTSPRKSSENLTSLSWSSSAVAKDLLQLLIKLKTFAHLEVILQKSLLKTKSVHQPNVIIL